MNKESLTIQELKALCEFFFKAGKRLEYLRQFSPGHRQDMGYEHPKDFEKVFSELMQDKYNKNIEQTAIETMWHEMNKAIEKDMEQFDRDAKIKAHQAMEDLRKIIITT